jgi:hypothetical protein
MAQHSLKTLSNIEATLVSPNGVHSGIDLTIQNTDSSAYVYVGGPGVSAANYGYRISPNNAIAFELPPRDAIYAITDTNNSKVAVIIIGLE